MLSRIEIVHSVAEIEATWRALEARSAATPFQTYRWMEAWSRLVAPSRSETPLLIVGRSADDQPVCLLPLATQSFQGAMVLGWLGQDHATYAMGLYADDLEVPITGEHLHEILAEITRRHPGISALRLRNQPLLWAGRPNPFANLGAQASANRSYQLHIEPDFEQQITRTVKKPTRGRLKRSLKALAAMPGYALVDAGTPGQRLDLLESFFAQKARQLAERGIPNPFQSQEIANFYRDLAGGSANRPSVLECHAITVDGHAVATATSISFQRQRHLLTLSLGTTDPVILKLSPGLALMRHHIAGAATAGIESYDFGAGDGQHKAIWQPAAVPLFDTFLPLSLRGYAVSLAAASSSFAKRIIKNNQGLWQAAQSARRLLNAKRG